jgi:hypothetical protein
MKRELLGEIERVWMAEGRARILEKRRVFS